MLKLGLTGGIGSGKTLVCQVFEKLGVPVFYADIVARDLMNTDAGLISEIVNTFGEKTYIDGRLNKQKLAELVFGDADRLSALNKLVHPVVRRAFIRWAGLQAGAPYVIEEAAILFESGASREMDQTILVHAPDELRIKRVMQRDAVSREQVLLRMGHQLSEEDKRKMADHVIINDGKQMLLPQVIILHNKILNSRE